MKMRCSSLNMTIENKQIQTIEFRVEPDGKTYPENEFNDNLKTLSSLKLSLNKNGVGVIDFLNINNVKNNLIRQNTEEIEGIKFNLKRCFIDGFLVKEIKFKHNFKQHTFKEKVRALTLSDFKDMFKRSKLEILHIFGDYKLNKFDINKSKRLIFIFK